MDGQVWAVPALPCPPLPDDEVHVWRVSVSRAAPAAAALETALSAEEAARVRRFRFASDRLTSTVARGFLRSLLGRYLNRPAAELLFTTNAHGKPALAAEPGPAELEFNLSHSGDWVVYALARRRAVGIDVEQMRPRDSLVDVARRFFSPREVAALLGLPESRRQEAFFHCWARKEAYIKALGGGLAVPLDQFEVSLVPEEPARLVGAWGEAAAPGPWSLRRLEVAPDYAAAVVVRGEDWRLRCWEGSVPPNFS